MDWMLGRLRFDRKASLENQERGEAVLLQAQEAVEKHHALEVAQESVLTDLRRMINTPLVPPEDHLVEDSILRHRRKQR